MPQLSSLKGIGYNYFGIPDFGDYVVVYNFADKTGDFNNIVSQLYFRQAMQHLEDQDGQIKAYLNGAGVVGLRADPGLPAEPVPAVQRRRRIPTRSASRTAITILKSNGWNVAAGGTDTCTTPGTGPADCGAGIPAGTKLAFNLIYNTISPYTQLTEDLASNAKAAGIEITLSGSNFNYMISNYNDTASPANANKWAMEDFGGVSQLHLPHPVRVPEHRRVSARSATTATRPRTR